MPVSPERSKLHAFALLAGALVLLVSALGGLGGRGLVLNAPETKAPPTPPVLLATLGELYAGEPFARLVAADRRDLFATDHFNPPKAPPVAAPAPQPPAARNVSVTYLGLLGGSGAPTAYLRVDKELLMLAPGGPVAGGWGVAEIGRDAVVVTNAAGARHPLEFRKPAPLEVPNR